MGALRASRDRMEAPLGAIWAWEPFQDPWDSTTIVPPPRRTPPQTLEQQVVDRTPQIGGL